MQRYALDALNSSGTITHREIAEGIGLTRSAISHRLRRYRKKMGIKPARPVVKTLRLVSLSLFAL